MQNRNNLQISGVTVLYHPSDKVLDNISTYISCLKTLYVIDNSINKNRNVVEHLEKTEKVQYIDNKGNQGIAQALNVAADLALKDKSAWLLTMDQDSTFEPEALQNMLMYIQSERTCNIGIVGPTHVVQNKRYRKKKHELPHEVLTMMTSGNLLNLDAFQKCGPFLEELFIDKVDNEYCLRLNSNGYKVVRLPAARLIHNLGASKVETILGIKINVTHHNYIRRYYIMRNRLFVGNLYRNQYPKWRRREMIDSFRDFFKIIFFEQDKMKKILAIIQGIKDYRAGKLGQYTPI